MFILKKGQQPGVYVPLRALFLVWNVCMYVRTYVRTYVCMYVCMYVFKTDSCTTKIN